MKKIVLLLLLLITIFSNGCKQEKTEVNIKEILNKTIETLNIPKETSIDLDLKTKLTIDDKDVLITWEIDQPKIINHEGKIFRGLTEKHVNISITIQCDGKIATHNFGEIVVNAYSKDEIFNILKSEVNIDNLITNDLSLPNSLNINSDIGLLSWQSNNEKIITSEGKVFFKTEEQSVSLNVMLEYEDLIYEYQLGNFTVAALSTEDYLNYLFGQIIIPSATKADITLPNSIDGVKISWFSNNESALTKNGEWLFNEDNIDIELKAIILYKGKIFEKIFPITVLTISHQERLDKVMERIILPETVDSNLNLPISFDYGVTGYWTSTNEDIVDNQGIVNLTTIEQTTTLTVNLQSGEQTMSKDFTITTAVIDHLNNHILVDYANQMTNNKLNNLTLQGEKLVLTESALLGDYISPIYLSNDFNTLVGSWAAITNLDATAELQIRVRVNDEWSMYFSYGDWGLGKPNAMNINQIDGIARMYQDELTILSNQLADAFQYKIFLRRTSLNVASPVLSLVAISLNIPNYQYNVDTSSLPKKVDYDVPQLNQNIVPNIGNSICSPTSATMLLMYKNHTIKGTYPHETNANLFYDHGNKIYGNWVYNTVGMSAYGENTYVKRIYSFEELQYHLATVGPVALSIKGDTGRYTTNGHLLVVRGYEINDQGTWIIVNDPNLSEVYYRYSYEVYAKITRNVIYVIE